MRKYVIFIYILYIYTHVDLHRKMLDSDRVFYALDFRKRLVDNTRHELMKSHQAGDPSADIPHFRYPRHLPM